MSGLTIRSLQTEWGFIVDDAALDRVEKRLNRLRMQAGKTIGIKFDGRGRLGPNPGGSDPGGGGGPRIPRIPGKSPGGGGNASIPGIEDGLRKIREAASSAKSAILGMVGAFAAGSFGIGGFFKMIGDFEQTEVAFETLIGDAKLAQKTLGDLRNFAEATPFNFSDVANLSKRLLAYDIAADELIPTMNILGNIAAGVGKDKLPQLVLAFGQVKSATKLTGAELRQFTEAGVPLISELAKSLGVANSEVQKMVEGGKVKFEDVRKALANVTGEGGRFNNLMQKQSGTLLGMFSNVVDKLQNMAIDLGKRGLLGKAKEYIAGVIDILTVNREQIIDGMQHAIEVTIIAMAKIADIGIAIVRVFKAMASAFGGTRNAVDLMVKAIFVAASARMLFTLGKLAQGVMSVGNAWLFGGKSALAAQLQMAAVPIAIGAALIGLALIVEDVVAYFQGLKSVTGIILKDVGNLSAGFDKVFDPIFEKIKSFGKGIGKTLMDGIAALSDADWKKIGDIVLKGLEFMFIASTIPIRIGLAIAEGIINGMMQGIREKFPKLAAALGLEDPANTAPGASDNDAKGFMYRFFDTMKSQQGTTGNLNKSLLTGPEGRVFDAIAEVVQRYTKTPIAETVGSNFLPVNAGRAGSVYQIKVDAPITVPPGTAPDQVQPMIEQGFKSGLETVLRETKRVNPNPVKH